MSRSLIRSIQEIALSIDTLHDHSKGDQDVLFPIVLMK